MYDDSADWIEHGWQEQGNASRGRGFGLGFNAGKKNKERQADVVQGMDWNDIFLAEKKQGLFMQLK